MELFLEIVKWISLSFVIITGVYLVCRIGSSAVFRSWWESKKEHEQGGIDDSKRS